MCIDRRLAVAVLCCLPSLARASGQGEPEADQAARMSLLAPRAPYEGEVSVVTDQGGGRRVQEVLVRFSPPARYRREIVDRLGMPLITIVSDGRTEWVYDRKRAVAWKGEPADSDYKLIDPDEEYDLLRRNYEFRLAGEDQVAGRKCRMLEIRSRKDGKLAQRIWSDREYGLVLRRESYREDGASGSSMRFVRVALPASADSGDFSFSPPSGVKVLPSRLKPDYMELDEAASATDMRPRPPSWLPPGYMFESVNILPYKGLTVLHYRYSDGIDVLSLFQCPRHARLGLSDDAVGEQKVNLRSGVARLAFSHDGKVLEWSAGDRFILVGSVGMEQLRRVADSVTLR